MSTQSGLRNRCSAFVGASLPLLAMAVALYTDPAPAVAEKVGDVRLQRA